MKVLIVGAGINGLALARRFDELSIDYTLIERTSHWTQDGAGICLPANAVEGIDKLGLKSKLLDIAHQVKQVSYVKPNGSVLASASLLEAPLDVQPFVSLPRVALLNLLREGMDSKVSFGTTINTIEQDGNKVDVTFCDETSDSFDLVVGADGINSQVRELVFDEPGLLDLGVTNWRFLINQDTNGLEPLYYLGSDSAFMRYPMPNGQVYCYAHVIDEQGEYAAAGKEWLLNKFSEFEPAVINAIAAVDNPDDLITGRLKAVKSREVYKGHVLLIGDALHGCPPTLQQGVGMGLEDVHLLAELLSSDDDVGCVMSKFKMQRAQRIFWVVDESNKVIRLASKGQGLLGRVIRNMMVRKMGPANVAGWRKLMATE